MSSLKDRFKARKKELEAMLYDAKADFKDNTNDARQMIEQQIQELDDIINREVANGQEAWDHLTDATKQRLNKLLEKDIPAMKKSIKETVSS